MGRLVKAQGSKGRNLKVSNLIQIQKYPSGSISRRGFGQNVKVTLREYERNRAGFRGVAVEELKSWGKAHEWLKPAAHQGVRRRSRLR